MTNILAELDKLINSLPPSFIVLFFSILSIYLILSNFYNKIKYECLRKAAEKVAEIEDKELSGKDKFAYVVLWIEEELPKIFRNTIIRKIIENIVQYAYDNCFKYAKNYIKRKTGIEISEVIKELNKDTNDDGK